jgi:hypothetical protein
MEKRKYKWRCKTFDKNGEVLVDHPILLGNRPSPIKLTAGGCYNDYNVDVLPGETRLCEGIVTMNFSELERSISDQLGRTLAAEITNGIEFFRLEITESTITTHLDPEKDCFDDVYMACKFHTGIMKTITPIDFASLLGDEPSTPRNSVES